MPAGHLEELSQPLLHQAGKALVVSVQGRAVYILDHCEERGQRRDLGGKVVFMEGQRRRREKEWRVGDGGWGGNVRKDRSRWREGEYG